MRNVDIDVMREILEEHGILVNEDIAKSITEYLQTVVTQCFVNNKSEIWS